MWRRAPKAGDKLTTESLPNTMLWRQTQMIMPSPPYLPKKTKSEFSSYNCYITIHFPLVLYCAQILSRKGQGRRTLHLIPSEKETKILATACFICISILETQLYFWKLTSKIIFFWGGVHTQQCLGSLLAGLEGPMGGWGSNPGHCMQG